MPLFQPKNHVLLAAEAEYRTSIVRNRNLNTDLERGIIALRLIFGPCYIPQEIKEMKK